jgi:starvation-inducible outer membrane lipoprotein
MRYPNRLANLTFDWSTKWAPRRIGDLLLWVLGFTALTGCTTVLSRAAMETLSPNVTAVEVRQAPERHFGDTVLIAGNVISAGRAADGSLIEVLAYPTTSRGYPDLSEPALGRFLLRYRPPLASVALPPGRTLAAAGRVLGRRQSPTGASQEPIPFLEALELKLIFDEPPAYFFFPIRIGFGISGGF